MIKRKLRGILVIFILILFGAVTFPESKNSRKPKIVISVDLEGIAHVVDHALGPSDFDYAQARRLTTMEVNAAIEGCLEAGAGEIVVSDGHGNSLSIIPEELHEAAILVRGWPRPLDMITGIDNNTNGVIFIGYHAKEGTPYANTPHTLLGRFDVKINGIYVSEALFNAALAGEFDVPIIMVTGDQHVEKEAREFFGPVETVITKKSLAYYSAQSPHPNLVRQKIKEKSKKAVQRIKEFKPFRFEPPIKMELIFQRTFDAETVSYFPWFKRKDGKIVVVELNSMKEAANIILGLGTINSR